MDSILKGNYSLKNKVNPAIPKDGNGKDPSIESAFESSAMEKLGGSIAFVKKSSQFVWKGK